MEEREVIVLCYWNGCIKYNPDGVYYEGATLKKVSVKQKTEFSRLVEGLHIITGLDTFQIFGRYPLAVSPNLFTYVHFPVVNDTSLKTMLEVPIIHPSLKTVELYLVATNNAASSRPVDNPCSSSKRQRTQEANGYVDKEVTPSAVKIEKNNRLEVDNSSTLGVMMDKSLGSDELALADSSNADKDLNVPGLEVSANACLNKGVGSSASKPCFPSSLWIDDHELREGLCFKDRDELKKAVDWCAIRGQKNYVVHETKKDEYMFKCVRWKCNWLIRAARMEEHGLVEITKCTGPHTCCPLGPDNFKVEFSVEEIECLIKVQPTLTVDELGIWWFKKFGYELEPGEMKAAKHEAIKKIYGDCDQSFILLPKLMVALHSSNGLLVDWRYDRFPNSAFASFRGVFWAFPQSIEGFTHCRPLISVATKDLNDMKLMIALGVDADDTYFPLAFAVTKEVSADSWRWFLAGIREKVTQRRELCLITSPDPDILAVINEPGSLWKEPWAYHRFCLDHLSSQFDGVFQNSRLKSLMKQAGSTKLEVKFNSYMAIIKTENLKARRWLDKIPPHRWALAHDGGRTYGEMTIAIDNMFLLCESFWSPGTSVVAAVLLLFDELRSFFRKGLYDSCGRVKCGDVYTKPVMDKVEEFRAASATYVVMPLDDNAFRVTIPLQKNRWTVQLSECTCTCGEFQAFKFPCLHALAVCEKLKINPLQYVDDCYSVERLHRTYAATFNPVPEVSAWPEASEVPTFFPIPPPPSTKVSDKSKQKTTQNKS